jgi:hypothetical protein
VRTIKHCTIKINGEWLSGKVRTKLAEHILQLGVQAASLGTYKALIIAVTGVEPNKWHERFEVFTAVTMKNGVFCDVTPCGVC